MERHLWYNSFKKTTNNLLLFRSTVTDRVLTWCPYYSYEVQTCVISSHEKLEIKFQAGAILFGLTKVRFETICECIKQLKLKFWSQM